jgi:ParB family chromosome partitioning protein
MQARAARETRRTAERAHAVRSDSEKPPVKGRNRMPIMLSEPPTETDPQEVAAEPLPLGTPQPENDGARSDAPYLVMLDPRLLVTKANVRHDLVLDDEFVASVEQHGVLEPVIIAMDSDGTPILYYGQRRTAAAIKAGVPEIPCIVRPSLLETGARILTQLDENDQRAPITEVERAAALFELSELGWSQKRIAKEARLKPAIVKTALAAARVSDAAKSAVGVSVGWDLTEIAQLREFEDDEAALSALKEAKARRQFAQQISYLREDRENQRKRAELAAQLAEAGVKVLEERPAATDKAKPVSRLYTRKGERIYEDAHASCPGHRVVIATDYRGKPVAVAYCSSPKDIGHVYSEGGRPGDKPKQDPRERKIVLANNRMWRGDRTRRHEYLVGFFARKAAPSGTARFVASYLAARPYSLSNWIGNYDTPLAPAFLGMPQATRGQEFSKALDAQIATASDKRLPLLQLVTIAAALEKELENTHCWRTPESYNGAREWLALLGKAGYPLSEFEKSFADGTSGDGLKALGASTQPKPHASAGPQESPDAPDNPSGLDDFDDDAGDECEDVPSETEPGAEPADDEAGSAQDAGGAIEAEPAEYENDAKHAENEVEYLADDAEASAEPADDDPDAGDQ